MKNIVLSLLFLSFFLISCESEDNGITYTTPDYITGKWNFSKIGAINSQGNVIYQDYPNTQTCESDNLVLDADGTFEINDFSLQGTNCANAVQSGDYSLVNKNLTIKYTEASVLVTKVYTILTLTYDEVVVVTTNSLGQLVFYKLTR
jgi:hypothetical protein